MNTHECMLDMYGTLPHDRKLFTVCYTVLWFGLSKCDQQVSDLQVSEQQVSEQQVSDLQVSDLQVSDLQVSDLLYVLSRLTSRYIRIRRCTCGMYV